MEGSKAVVLNALRLKDSVSQKNESTQIWLANRF